MERGEAPVGGNNRRNMKYSKAHHAHRRRDGAMRSSAMSDTSEAPSLASHVRRVRVPSQVILASHWSMPYKYSPLIGQ